MTGDDLTAAGLDHLQRVGFVPPPPGTACSLTQASAALRTMVRVTGIGRLNKGGSGAAGTAEQEDATGEFGGPAGSPAAAGGRSPLAKDLLVSLYNYMVPLAFLVSAEPGRAAIRIGTWLPAESTSQSSDQNGRLLTTSLNTLYPSVDLVDESPGPSIDVWPPRGWQRGGLVMGIPTPKPPDPTDGAAQLDRLLRALHQFDWAALVLAQPVGEGLVRDLKLRLINDMRIAQTASTLGGVPSPLTQHYLELMARQLKAFTDARAPARGVPRCTSWATTRAIRNWPACGGGCTRAPPPCRRRYACGTGTTCPVWRPPGPCAIPNRTPRPRARTGSRSSTRRC
ncbi:hypothetical protein ABZ615_07640 [Streptomyces sp. NPDC007325]|uniref:hypothetical protein n=1 Tax=Streptomyces sp. NPDC007325 TaxID=3154588 RepID=UPI0033CCD58C